MPAELSNSQLLLEQRMKLIEQSRNLNVINLTLGRNCSLAKGLNLHNKLLTTFEYLAAATHGEFSLITVPKQGHKTIIFYFAKYSKQMVPFEISTDEEVSVQWFTHLKPPCMSDYERKG